MLRELADGQGERRLRVGEQVVGDPREGGGHVGLQRPDAVGDRGRLLARLRSPFRRENEYRQLPLALKFALTLVCGLAQGNHQEAGPGRPQQNRNIYSDEGSMKILALDAGGTSTRAVALDPAGTVLGHGRAAAGNPTAAGIVPAAEAIAAASAAALAEAGSAEVAVIAMAGEQSDAFRAEVTRRLAAYGVTQVVLEHDLLALFCSGTPSPDGYALIAGTGTVAARVVDGGLARVVGGRGWLLGDAGGGFWIGRRVARAVVAALDGQTGPTALTALVLAALGISTASPDPDSEAGRVAAIRQMVSAVYARRPVALAELAPLAFAVPDDPVARSIVVAASRALADLVAAVRVPELDGPVVVGGSVIARGILGAGPGLAADLVPVAGDTPVIPVPDGLVGAAVLALRHTGSTVDDARFTTLQAQVLARTGPGAELGVLSNSPGRAGNADSGPAPAR